MSPFMILAFPFARHAFLAASFVAVAAGWIGFYVVLRGTAFAAHALPKVGFAGASGALLLGVNSLVGVSLYSAVAALGIGALAERDRRDVATALVLALGLGTGALFLSLGNLYAEDAMSLLFGQVLGVSSSGVMETACVSAAGVLLVAAFHRRLLFTTVAREAAAVRGASNRVADWALLVSLGLVTSAMMPVVGALLSFSLLVGPALAARHLARRPWQAIVLSIVLSLGVTWLSLLLSFALGWPVGFFVACLSVLAYASARAATRGFGRRLRR
ncbi:metal ABC transporter permease [Alicyclobacillus acidocaldarius]|uniref:ABC-3 protein n=1 Tax=Alicyclobacillus acidocaldarius subsp. acidocaldarius (strain ATCC 27009 / DSM 446 / BCRC 14685 / JCM 5260 / KCTC 1825 / NBRC 15652 / NCIMB 11725 / NRRL B-14509 / 104-IA) TaxID=521098 RepID=C8WTA6_ALIAD|nr:metal ABC transporter permease [Alicyclobacillus acidocaldarius]ACV59620.1 ABC-3 protein [Alicyclobacillus acidocaldarius subsp. acidocaldarius DSM 446]